MNEVSGETGVTGEPLHSVTLLTFAAREARRLLTPSVVRSFPRLLPVGFPFSFGSGTLREARMNGENDEPHGGGQEPTRETKGTRRGPSETGEVSPEVG